MKTQRCIVIGITGLAAGLFLAGLFGGLTASAAADKAPEGGAPLGAPAAAGAAFTFTQVVSPLVPLGLGNGPVAWGDYDGDGRLDLLMTGCLWDAGWSICDVPFTAVYRNIGAGFSQVYTWSTGGAYNAVAWGDANNDGRLDFVLSGKNNDEVWVFENTGSGFAQVYTLTALSTNSLAFGDYDNDGRADLIVGAWAGDYSGVWVYHNTGSGFTQAYTLTTGDSSNSLAWGDYDRDGRLDVMMSTDGYGGGSAVYRNTGDGFTQTSALTALAFGQVAWGDYDRDGYLDIVETGQDIDANPQAFVFHNSAGLGFTPAYTLTGISKGSAAWGDYDNDGYPDLLLTGCADWFCSPPASQVWHNDGGSGFSLITTTLPGVVSGSAAWGDYDNDGRLDVALIGCQDPDCTASISAVYRNGGTAAVSAPAAPTRLGATVNDHQVTFRWDHTPATGVSYNLVVTPAGSATYALSPLADATSGYRRVPALGNAQNGPTATLAHLPEGDYFWNAQAIDSAWQGGAWAGGGRFSIGSYIITPTAGPGGRLTPDTPQTVARDGAQAFLITPDPGYRTINVGVDGVLQGAIGVYTFTHVAANHTITAAFAINFYTLITATSGTGSGAISLNPAGGPYAYGTPVTATASAATGSSFAGWSGDCSGAGACGVTMTANRAITAAFALNTFVITPTVGAGGHITPGTPQTVSYGASQSFTIAPDPGYRTVNVGVDGVLQGAIGGYTFTHVSASHTISASFARVFDCVGNTNDSGAGSLRQMVADAAPGATICFDSSLAGKTITLTSHIGLGKNLTISGTVPITLSGNNATYLFYISPDKLVTLYGLTLINGKDSNSQGAAIDNGGILTVSRSVFRGNHASHDGGAIRNAGTLTVTDSLFSGNSTQMGGGAIVNLTQATISRSAFRDNYAVNDGGAICNGGTLFLTDSTLANNSAGGAGAAGLSTDGATSTGWLLGLAAVLGLLLGLARNPVKRARWLAPVVGGCMLASVLAGCIPGPGSGGGLSNRSGAAMLTHVTLVHNQASARGGAIYNNGGSVTVGSSVFSQNSAPVGASCGGAPIISNNDNAASDGSCMLGQANDLNNAEAQTQAMQPNGAAPLLADSVAIDHVSSATLCAAPDQLGQARSTPICDAGAVEFAGAPLARLQTALRPSANAFNQGRGFTFTVAAQNIGAAPATGLAITLTLPAGLNFQGTPIVAGGACTGSLPTLTCTTSLARNGLLTVNAGVTVTTPAVDLLLTETVTVTAAGGMISVASAAVRTVAIPPPPPVIVCGGSAYPTIQSAVNAAPAGATVLVCPGAYQENVTINKSLTIRSQTGAVRTIVDGQWAGSVFVIGSGIRVTLDGLTIRYGSAHSGAGILNAGTLTVTRSTLYGNTAPGIDSLGGGIYNRGTLIVNSSTLNGNTAGVGGGINNLGTLTVNNSTFSLNTATHIGGGLGTVSGIATVINSTFSNNKAGNKGGGLLNAWVDPNSWLVISNTIVSRNSAGTSDPGIGNYAQMTVQNSVLQENLDGSNNTVADPKFVRTPGANGADDYGDLHLNTGSPAMGRGQNCSGADQDGVARQTPNCSAGAYEYNAAIAAANPRALDAQNLTAQAARSFTTTDGAVRLEIPSAAVTQTVSLAFSLGRVTGGDPSAALSAGGRERSVVFTPYDAAGQPLAEDFSFLQPLTLTLGYDPALVTQGLEVDLLPLRLNAATGSWAPFTLQAVVDLAARTVKFPIVQAGEYGLFSLAPGQYADIAAFTPSGVANLAGGSAVTYTLTALNADRRPVASLLMSHTLPAGLSFVSWVETGTAACANGAVTWPIPFLAGGGLQQVSFRARISDAVSYQGQTLVSAAALSGPNGPIAGGETRISINGPTTPVTDNVTTRPGAAVSFWPLSNDLNPDQSPITITALGQPAHGAASLDGSTVAYTPTAGFEGTDTFTYTVRDGQFNADGVIHVRVARLAFLFVSKTVASADQSGPFIDAVWPGSEVTYTLMVFNAPGGEIAASARLTDALPAGVQFSRWITQSGATLNGGTLTWSAASVPTGAVATISFRAVVTAAAGAGVDNIVYTTAANADLAAAGARVEMLTPRRIYLPLVR